MMSAPGDGRAGDFRGARGRCFSWSLLGRQGVLVGLVAFVVLVLVLVLGAASVLAAVPAPDLSVHVFDTPTDFSAATEMACLGAVDEDEFRECDVYQVTITNSGGSPETSPLVITDTLPAHVTERALSYILRGEDGEIEEEPGPCEGEAVPIKCEFAGVLKPGQWLELEIAVLVGPEALSGEPSVASVSLGGASAPVASVTSSDVVSSSLPPFGPNALLTSLAGVDGAPDTQAGAHPYEFTTRFDLSSEIALGPETTSPEQRSVGYLRDVVVDLPVGLVGSAVATPKCTLTQLSEEREVHSPHIGGCPPDTQVGHIFTDPSGATTNADSPIYNIEPEHGFAAEFGFVDLLHNTHVIDASIVPTPSGYVARATSPEIPEIELTDATAVFYGDPAERDAELRQQRIERETEQKVAREPPATTPVAMFTNPSDCSGAPLQTTMDLDSWEAPGAVNAADEPILPAFGEESNWKEKTSSSPPVTGCNALRFSPEAFSVTPETTAADSPTGLNFQLKIPQSENPGTLATPPLRDASVTLPTGLSADPALASGLEACSEAQIGWLGGSLNNFTPEAPSCPEASRIGTVEVTSPLLERTLSGSVYLATQDENPFHTLFAGYIVVDDPRTGIIVKIAGDLTPNPQTGQITAVFDENPQLPFSDLKVHMFGGARGDLATPEGCGTYTTNSDFSPWSAPASGPDATPSSSFEINSGCVSGFTPSLVAGTTNPQAGGYSPLTVTLSRNDTEEGLQDLSVVLPPGLVGKIAGVGECPQNAIEEATGESGTNEQAHPSCPASSRLGTVQTAVGPGPDPYLVSGNAYLTGAYKGAPFGIAVIVPSLAGPFDLGTVVVRQALYVDPNDGHVTDVSDPFPTMLDGVPLRVKHIEVTINRPEFMLNPTSCEPKTINATVTSINNANAAVSSRFQADNCASLGFHPTFTASTSGRTSKTDGASLDIKITYPKGAYANIAKSVTDLPYALPSRLTTIQKACPDSTFDANPAACDQGSVIGEGIVHTPLFTNPLTGPAYLVSHTNRAFPDIEIVLQGEGITLILDGNTDIKKGITKTTFNTVPDAPVETFELLLPEGPHSALAANTNLCKPTKTITQHITSHTHGHTTHKTITKTITEPLNIPTKLTAQNGLTLTQTTKITVTNCPTPKTTKKATKTKKTKKKP
jgi:hypothetical protein